MRFRPGAGTTSSSQTSEKLRIGASVDSRSTPPFGASGFM